MEPHTWDRLLGSFRGLVGVYINSVANVRYAGLVRSWCNQRDGASAHRLDPFRLSNHQLQFCRVTCPDWYTQ